MKRPCKIKWREKAVNSNHFSSRNTWNKLSWEQTKEDTLHQGQFIFLFFNIISCTLSIYLITWECITYSVCGIQRFGNEKLSTKGSNTLIRKIHFIVEWSSEQNHKIKKKNKCGNTKMLKKTEKEQTSLLWIYFKQIRKTYYTFTYIFNNLLHRLLNSILKIYFCIYIDKCLHPTWMY